MKYEKPNIDEDCVKEIIKKTLSARPENLKENEGGQIARTFSFSVNGKGFFIQFNRPNMSQGTLTEQNYYSRLKARGVPVRTIVAEDTDEGRDGTLHYAITEEARGTPLEELKGEEFTEQLPRVYEAAVNIGKVEITGTRGYGWFTPEGNGMFPSWKAHLKSIIEEEPDEMFYGKWFTLFEETFLEKERYEHYYGLMEELFPLLPEDRRFQHGNFSQPNTLIHEGRISAIIDWQDARFGDDLYDMAGFTFWMPADLRKTVLKDFKSYYESRGGRADSYYERIRCYHYFLGLDALRFFAKADNREAYDYVVGILGEIEDLRFET